MKRPLAYGLTTLAMLSQVKPGDAIRFAANHVDGPLTIVRLEPGA